jgi:hypothetical protein
MEEEYPSGPTSIGFFGEAIHPGRMEDSEDCVIIEKVLNFRKFLIRIQYEVPYGLDMLNILYAKIVEKNFFRGRGIAGNIAEKGKVVL